MNEGDDFLIDEEHTIDLDKEADLLWFRQKRKKLIGWVIRLGLGYLLITAYVAMVRSIEPSDPIDFETAKTDPWKIILAAVGGLGITFLTSIVLSYLLATREIRKLDFRRRQVLAGLVIWIIQICFISLPMLREFLNAF